MTRSVRQQNSSRRACLGFTLVELLVVLSVIGVLVSIIFPVLARAKEKAYLAQCTSNARQLGFSIQVYMQDYDDLFPWARTVDSGPAAAALPTLITVLEPYVENNDVWFCPSWLAEHGDLMTGTRSLWRSYKGTYGYNAYPGMPDTLLGRSLEEIDNPEGKPMLWCASGSAHASINATEWAAGAVGAVNSCYVDGHVKLFRGTLREWTQAVHGGAGGGNKKPKG